MNPTLRTLFAVPALLASSACADTAPDFAGVFADASLKMTLAAKAAGDNAAYTGSIQLGGVTYEARATANGADLRGEFEHASTGFPFTARFEAEQLVFVTGETTYRLRRQVASNPLAKVTAANPLARDAAAAAPEQPAASQAAAPTAKLAADSAGTQSTQSNPSTPSTRSTQSTPSKQAAAPTQLYKHHTGLFLRHPASWKIKELPGGALSLLPADLHMVGTDQAEAFVLAGEEAPAIRAITDPNVERVGTGFTTQSFPFLRRRGSSRQLQAGGRQCIELRFAGRSQGIDFEASMALTLLNGHVIGALTLTPKDRFEARRQTMAAVFASLGYRAPGSGDDGSAGAAGDPRLVGQWRYSKTYISGSFSSITVRNLVLQADGTCYEGGKLYAGMSHHDSEGNFEGSTSANSNGGYDSQGRWRVEGKKIILTWRGGGTAEWGYYIEGGSMLWSAGKTRKLWKKVR